MVKISVLTPTIRPHRLAPVYESLKRQTFKDFEWLVEFGLSDTEFTLPADMNKMLRRARGEIVVIWQDSISAPDDFLETVIETHRRFLLGCDDRHPDRNDGLRHTNFAVTYPVGKRHGESVDWDWRAERRGKVGSHEWETDLASCPRHMFEDIGGYDEAFCDGWSWDNVEVGYRAAAAGYSFYCVGDVRAVADDHDAEEPHPFRRTLPPNFPKANETKRRADAGDYRLDFLSAV